MQYFLAFIFLIIFIVIYKVTGDWFSIARINALIWLIFLWAYAILYPTSQYYWGSVWLIAFCTMFAIGEHFGNKIRISATTKHAVTSYRKGNENSRRRIPSWVWSVLFGIIVLALIGDFLELRAFGYDLSVFFDLKRFLNMNSNIAQDRYFGNGGTGSLLITVLTSFRYCSALCAGYFLNVARRKRQKFLCVSAFIPVILNLAINNTKIGLIAGVMLFAVGYCMGFMFFNGRSPKVQKKHIVVVTAVLLALVFALLFAMMARIGSISASTFEIVKKKFAVYAFGHMEAFNYWLSQKFEFGSYGLGVNTFLGPFSLLGLEERQQGVYEFINGIGSNIFTAYRGVILDWGVIGGIFVMFLVGILSGYSKKVLLATGRMGLSYAALLFSVLYAFVISPWIYNSYWLSFILFFIVIKLMVQRKTKEIKWEKRSPERNLRKT